MRSGAASAAKPGALRWVRPLQSIVCMFAPNMTKRSSFPSFVVDDIVAGNVTYGHRFHAPGPITVRRFDDYAASLEKAKVVLDAERRKQIILQDAQNLAFASGLELVEDEGLLDEVSGLVEYPHVLMGTFEEEFLEIPAEIIRLTIKTNQKCFVCRPQGGEGLANRFILVSNIAAKDDGKEIMHGNGKVVRARLSDAAHFYKRDQRDMPDLGDLKESAAKFGLDLKKPLDQRMAKLDHLGVTFHAKLGSQGERVSASARWRPNSPRSPALTPPRSTAPCSGKADLRTEAVGEFPELQGLMGRKYALLQGEDADVAAAIEKHYKPLGPSDSLPTNPVAVTGRSPTSSTRWSASGRSMRSRRAPKDPYALRRAALGVIRVLLEKGVRLKLLSVAKIVPTSSLSFFHDRLKVYLRDLGARHDIIDAVLTPDADDLLMVARRAEALTAFITSEDGKNLLAGTKRATQLLAAEEKKGTKVATSVDDALFTEEAEKALFAAVALSRQEADEAVKREDFRDAMAALSKLRARSTASSTTCW